MGVIAGTLVGIGAQGLVTQVVLVREFFAVFAGNEISAGVLLAGWLLFEGVGAWFAGRFSTRNPERLSEWLCWFGLVSGFSSIFSVAFVIYSPRLFGLLPGETISLPLLLWVSGLAVVLPASSHGALFALGAEFFSAGGKKTGVSRTYAWEGLGTFSAGLLLYFYLFSRLPGIGIAGLFSGIMLVALAFITRQRVRSSALLVTGSLLVFFGSEIGARLEPVLQKTVWHGQRVLSVRESAYGKLITLEREGQRQIVYDGTVVLNIPEIETATNEQVVHLPLLVHKRPRRVLILGSGPNGLVKELLKYPVEEVVTVQIDPVLLAEIRRAGGKTIAGIVADPRVRQITADPRRFLESTADSFDVVIVALPAAVNLNTSRLFTVQFFQRCAARLKVDGMVVTRTPGSADNLVPEAGVIAGIREATLGQVFPHCYAIGLDIPLMIGSRKPLVLNPDTVARRLAAMQLELSVLTPVYLRALLDSFRQKQFQRGIVSSQQVNDDLKPRELFFNLLRESVRSHYRFARLLATLPGLLAKFWLPVLIMTVIVAIGAGRWSPNAARGFGIFSSGFAGAAISTLTVMVYQIRFGSVYSGVALLFASFMLGTVAGALLSGLTVEKIGSGRRAGAVLFLGGDCLLSVVPGILALLTRWGGPLLPVLLLLLSGTVLGWEFGIASIERQAAGGRGGVTAGILSVLDFTGGALGGFLTAVIMVPVAGLTAAFVLVAVFKLVSAICQLLTIGGSRFTIQRV
ncbi:MAG: hypothetical protein ACP5JB_07020 [candidate division WOR-3 bacterium]